MPETFIPVAIETVEEDAEKPTKTYRLDLDKGRIIGSVDGLAAVNQAIRKAIITPRFKCLIYDNQYGSEIKNAIITQDATPEYAAATIPGFVKDALAQDTRILDIYDFMFEQQNERAYISFKADTIYGEAAFEEVI